MNSFSAIFDVLGQTLQIYSFILIVRVLLTWFPSIDWSNGVLSAICSITDPYLNLFRGIIPPIGGFDISSILAFLLLSVVQDFIRSIAISPMFVSY
tara:strand:+ start:219 stop:506 length:288 start_codon:yes stop_codon:yes gene_type:complete